MKRPLLLLAVLSFLVPLAPVCAGIGGGPASTLEAPLAQLAALQAGSVVPGTQIYQVEADPADEAPLFDRNALLLAEPAPYEQLAVGDIVAFRDPERGVLVLRLLERDAHGFRVATASRRKERLFVTPDNYEARVYGVLYTSRDADRA